MNSKSPWRMACLANFQFRPTSPVWLTGILLRMSRLTFGWPGMKGRISTLL